MPPVTTAPAGNPEALIADRSCAAALIGCDGCAALGAATSSVVALKPVYYGVARGGARLGDVADGIAN